jgi:lipid A 3-O-deacylase
MAFRSAAALLASLFSAIALAFFPGAQAADELPSLPDLLTPTPDGAPSRFLPVPTPEREANSFELRAGAFLHGIGTSEKGGVDANIELLAPRLPIASALPVEWQFLVPRPQFGAMLNPDGKTSYGYAGVAWTVNLVHFLPRFFLEPMFGGAIHDGNGTGIDIPHESTLGCPVLFHTGLSAGYRVTEQWTALFTWDHISNGGLCSRNVGLNEYGVKIGYSFW